MNRTTRENPHDKTKTIITTLLNEDERKVWVGDTGLDAVPTGFRGFIHVSGNKMEYGIERIDGGHVPTPDKIAGKSLAELQTACAMKNIKYTKDDSVAVLIEKLKAKG